MTTRTNCPNCGAVIKDNVCEYCGTQFFDMSIIETDKPFYMTIRNGGDKYTSKVYLSNAQVESYDDPLSCRDINGIFNVIHNRHTTINMTFVVVS